MENQATVDPGVLFEFKPIGLVQKEQKKKIGFARIKPKYS